MGFNPKSAPPILSWPIALAAVGAMSYVIYYGALAANGFQLASLQQQFSKQIRAEGISEESTSKVDERLIKALPGDRAQQWQFVLSTVGSLENPSTTHLAREKQIAQRISADDAFGKYIQLLHGYRSAQTEHEQNGVQQREITEQIESAKKSVDKRILEERLQTLKGQAMELERRVSDLKLQVQAQSVDIADNSMTPEVDSKVLAAYATIRRIINDSLGHELPELRATEL